tara:strand:+ start:3184 stop:3819 length:636 start_codon:yes stop_codon:yes gene_type:complete
MLDYIKGTHKDAGIKYENHNDILITPLFKESFCKELCKIGDKFKNKFDYWHQGNAERSKDSTLYFNILKFRYFAGQKFFEDFTLHYSKIILPMIKKEWLGTQIVGWFDPFIVRYDGDKKEELTMHNDVSHITMVVKLNNSFEGGVLKLPRQKFNNKKIPVGYALIWPSQVTHPHLVTPVTKGVKYSMTSWTWPVFWNQDGIIYNNDIHGNK